MRYLHRDRRWTVRLTTADELAPTPLAPERRAPRTCVELSTGTDVRTRDCTRWRPWDAGIHPVALVGCSGEGTGIAMLVRPPIATLSAELGDGRRLQIATVPVPGDATTRTGLLLLHPRTALRTIVGRDAAGRVVETVRVAVAPATASCSPGATVDRAPLQANAIAPLPRRRAGDHDVAALERGDALCLSRRLLPPTDADCGLPPVTLEQSWFRPSVAHGREALLGVVPAEVAAAQLRLDDGRTVDAVTTAVPGYAGRYAAVTRILRAIAPRGRRVLGVRLFDAGGRRLVQFSGPDVAPVRDEVPILRPDAALPPLKAGVMEQEPLDQPRQPCLTFAGIRGLLRCDVPRVGDLTVEAVCAPRRLVVYGAAARPGDVLEAVTADGRRMRARAVAVPAETQVGGAAMVVLPADRSLLRVVVRWRERRPAWVPLPPVAEQCGYRRFVTLGRSRG